MGVRCVPLSNFKMSMRDLKIVPQIATEYKITMLFKFFDICKEVTNELHDEEVITTSTFMKAFYILFSIALEESTPLKDKCVLIGKWVNEQLKEKRIKLHGTKETTRLRYSL